LEQALYRMQIRLMTMIGAGFVATSGLLATLIQLSHH